MISHCLVGEAGNATKLMDLIEHSAIGIIVVLKAYEFPSAQRNRMADFGRARFFLSTRHYVIAFLISSIIAKPVLGVVSRPEIAHLKKIADVNVFRGNPAQDGRIVAWRPTQVD